MKYQGNKRLTFGEIPWRFLLVNPSKLSLFLRIRRVYPYTQLSYAGLCQMHEFVTAVEARGIQGSIVEMGCGRGGCGAVMLKASKSPRNVWLFDSFEGLSEPSEKDRVGTKKEAGKVQKGYLAVSKESALEIAGSLAPDSVSRLHVVKGWFQDSLPAVKTDIGAIAILRLDADLYEPTLYCLREMYDKVAVGGYIVIDDYKKWIGARKALFEFFGERGIAPYVTEYPAGGVAYFVKE
jgi:hypothetical protein